MTETRSIPQKRNRRILAFGGAFLLLLLSLSFAEAVLEGIRKGLSLCAHTIIPSLFPFMVLSDMLGAAFSDLPHKNHSRGILLMPFLLGALCGFPIGMRSLTELWKKGILDEAEGNYLLTFVNNTGPAFLIAGIGEGLFGSRKLGIFLYLAELFAAGICALIFYKPFPKKKKTYITEEAVEIRFSFIESVRKCAGSMLYICALVVLFSSLASLLAFFCKNRLLLSFIYAFLEVGGAAQMASELAKIAFFPAVLLVSFAVSFGGFSVHMQSFLFLDGTPFSKCRYLVAKLLQGAVSPLFMLILFPLL